MIVIYFNRLGNIYLEFKIYQYINTLFVGWKQGKANKKWPYFYLKRLDHKGTMHEREQVILNNFQHLNLTKHLMIFYQEMLRI